MILSTIMHTINTMPYIYDSKNGLQHNSYLTHTKLVAECWQIS